MVLIGYRVSKSMNFIYKQLFFLCGDSIHGSLYASSPLVVQFAFAGHGFLDFLARFHATSCYYPLALC